jgi:hypothetical protein
VIGTLYYDDNAGWTSPAIVGTLRMREKGYKVTPIVDDDRSGNPVTVAYEVEVNALVSTFDATFKTADTWYFRVYFPDTEVGSAYIDLGEREYVIDYDGQINRNTIQYSVVKLKFVIDTALYGAYSTTVSVPPP